MEHKPGCQKRHIYPASHSIRPLFDFWDKGHTCATRKRRWGNDLDQVDGRPVWQDPWRSEWAAPQSNPYVCTECFDERLREKPFPKPHSLPCLCARRQYLQVFLVCRQWYAEAGRAFYSRNEFAFAHPIECVDFMRTLSARWRPLISKVSLLVLAAHEGLPANWQQMLEMLQVPVEGEGGASPGFVGVE
ncbi:hypothetical protein PG987_013851 [Apiospora arundinis]